jgi:hypothetical protein
VTPGDRGPAVVSSNQPPTAGDVPAQEHLSEHRHERIRLETARHRIEGLLTLSREGYRSRVSDVLNASERDFLTLTDVSLQPLDGGPSESHPFLAVARGHIVFAVSPPEEPGE